MVGAVDRNVSQGRELGHVGLNCFVDFQSIFRRAEKVGIVNRIPLDEVHFSAEQCFKIELQAHVPLERSVDRLIDEVDEKIVVTGVRIEVVPQRGPEQFESTNAVPLAERAKLVSIDIQHVQGSLPQARRYRPQRHTTPPRRPGEARRTGKIDPIDQELIECVHA